MCENKQGFVWVFNKIIQSWTYTETLHCHHHEPIDALIPTTKIQSRTKTYTKFERENQNTHKPIATKSPPTSVATSLNPQWTNPHQQHSNPLLPPPWILHQYPQQKFKAKPKPTSNLRERIGVREREDWNERKRENPPSSPLQATMPSPPISKPPRCCRQSSVHATDFDLQSMPIWERHWIRERGERKEDEKWERGVTVWLKEERERSDILIEFVFLGLIF